MVTADLLDQTFSDIHLPVFIPGTSTQARRGKDLHIDGILLPEPLREAVYGVAICVWTELEKIDAALAVEFRWADHLSGVTRQSRQVNLRGFLADSACACERKEQAAGQKVIVYLAGSG